MNLYPEASKDDNSKRRDKRHSRRTLRRRKQRVKDYKLLVSNHFKISLEEIEKILEKRNNINLLEKRKEATESKIDTNDLFKVLLYYVIHRGYLNVEATESDESDNKVQQLEVKRESKELVVNKQLAFFKANGYYRGNDNLIYADPNVDIINNSNFSNTEYLFEIDSIFKNNPLPQDFIDKYKQIVKRKRDFSQGPGQPSSLQDNNYSLYIYDNNTNQFIKDPVNQNLWDKLVGKCSIYHDEKRTYKSNISFELFSALSELSNIRIDNELFNNGHISLEDQKELINSLIEKKVIKKTNKQDWSKMLLSTSKIVKFLNKKYSLNLQKDEIKGYRIDSSNKEVFTELKTLRKILNFFELNGFLKEDINLFDLNTRVILDKLCFLCSQYNQDMAKRNDLIINQFFADPFNKSIFKKMPDLKSLDSFKTAFGSGTGSLSLKAINDLIEKYLNNKHTDFMANIIIELKDVVSNKSDLNSLKKYKYLPVDERTFFNTDFMPPAVIRSSRQAIKILNEIFKQYGIESVKSIGIELAREYNSKDEKKAQNDLQKMNKEAKDWLKESYGIDLETQQNKGTNTNSRSNALLKVMLFLEQGKKCIYTGKELAKDVKEIFANPHLFDIDHILPISKSFNDSRSNKVLTTRSVNALKNNRTPLSFLSGKEKEDFRQRVISIYGDNTYDKANKLLSNVKYRKNKRDNLLYELDINNFENQLGFISRNLNDTRYITSLISSTLKDFFKVKEYDINVFQINGKLTSLARKHLLKDYKKSREESHEHHAYDASLVAYLSSPHSKLSSLLLKSEEYSFDKKTGEVNINDFKEDLLGISDPSFKKSLIESKTNLTYKINPKTTKQISDDTRYGLYKNKEDNKTYMVSSINIYKAKVEDLYKKFFSEDPSIEPKKRLGILLKEYEKLKKIFFHYYEIDPKKNPFESHIKHLKEIKDFKELKKVRNLKKFSYLDSSIEAKQNMIWDKYTNVALWDTVKPVGVDIYLNDKNKLVGIPLNALTFKFHSRAIDKEFKKDRKNDFFKLRPEESKEYLKPNYYERLEQRKADPSKFVRRIHLGHQLLEIEGSVYYVTSFTEISNGEQKFDIYKLESVKKERQQKSINFFINSETVYTNILGNKIKKEDFIPQHLKSMLK